MVKPSLPKWDIGRFIFLRPRRISDEEKRYGTFNRRMIAATIDMTLATLLITPVVDFFFFRAYGAPAADMQQIAAIASREATSVEAMRSFMAQMRESGLLDRMAANFRWQICVLAIYVTLCWHYWAATPGKMLCRLKIVDAKTGQPMKDWQSIVRLLGYFASALPLGLGFAWIGLNRKRRGWHDLLAGTAVVRH